MPEAEEREQALGGDLEDLSSLSAMMEWFEHMVPDAPEQQGVVDPGELDEDWLAPSSDTPAADQGSTSTYLLAGASVPAGPRANGGMGGVPFGDPKPREVRPPALRPTNLRIEAIDIPEEAVSPSLTPLQLNTKKDRGSPLALVPALFLRGEPLRIVVAGAQGGAGRTTCALDLSSVAARLGALGGVGVALWEATGCTSYKGLLHVPDGATAPGPRTVSAYRTPAKWGRFTLVPGPSDPADDLTLEEAVALDSHLTFRHHVVIAELPSHPRALGEHLARRAAHLLRGAHAVVVPVVPAPGAVEAVRSTLTDVMALGGTPDSIWLLVRDVPVIERKTGGAKTWKSLGLRVARIPDRRDAVVDALLRGVPPSLIDESLQEAFSSLFSSILDSYRSRKSVPAAERSVTFEATGPSVVDSARLEPAHE